MPRPLTQTAPHEMYEAGRYATPEGETPGGRCNTLCPRQDSNLRHPL